MSGGSAFGEDPWGGSDLRSTAPAFAPSVLADKKVEQQLRAELGALREEMSGTGTLTKQAVERAISGAATLTKQAVERAERAEVDVRSLREQISALRDELQSGRKLERTRDEETRRLQDELTALSRANESVNQRARTMWATLQERDAELEKLRADLVAATARSGGMNGGTARQGLPPPPPPQPPPPMQHPMQHARTPSGSGLNPGGGGMAGGGMAGGGMMGQGGMNGAAPAFQPNGAVTAFVPFGGGQAPPVPAHTRGGSNGVPPHMAPPKGAAPGPASWAQQAGGNSAVAPRLGAAPQVLQRAQPGAGSGPGSARPVGAQVSGPPTSWKCAHCTFLNHSLAILDPQTKQHKGFCEICEGVTTLG